MRINYPELRGLSTERILVIITLKVVYSINALLVKYNQTFVGGPAELDNLSLIPLLAKSNSVLEADGFIFGTDRKD